MEIKTSFITIGEGDNQIQSLLETLNVYDQDGNITNEVTEDEKWDLIRRLRDELLTQSDWVVIKAMEEGTTVSQDWLDYRNALRDIPQDYDSPEEVILPEIPE